MTGFEQRHKEEQQFHDKKATCVCAESLYHWGVLARADQYAYELIGDLQGKLVLDLGCGAGHHAINFAEKGATVYAIDISAGMVEKARAKIKESGLESQVTVIQMNAEEMDFPNETFDVVFGHSILHHTRLELTRGQVYRVLKRGGKGVFLEPLGHNPLINLFRKVTPNRRTATEKPLKISDIFFFAEPFSALKHREFYFLALATFALKPLKNRRLFQRILDQLSRLDENLFARWPTIGQYAWVTVFEVIK